MRFFLAVLLSLLWSQAAAVVSTTTNQVQYTGNGSTAAYTIPFKFFQNADLVVTENNAGVITTEVLGTNYTLVGAGFPTGGTITLTAGALPSGVILTVARDPAQVQDTSLPNGAPYFGSTVESAFDLACMQIQATRSVANRSIQFPLGDATSALLPSPPLRANTFLGFSGTGAMLLSGQTSPPGAITAWLNVKAYGATGNGVTDDTSAINVAAAAASTAAVALYFPAGNYIYNGTGISGSNISVLGDGINLSTVTLGSGDYFINSGVFWNSLYVHGMTFVGGAGAIAHTWGSANVPRGTFTVSDCMFYNFTGTAVYTLATDMPQWTLDHCWFYAANDTTSIAFADNALCDGDVINRCFFCNQAVGIKLKCGNGMMITGCDFFRSTAYTSHPRTSLWCLPQPSYGSNAGIELRVASSFGSENLNTADYYVVYADPITGSGDFSTQLPNFSTPSTGYILQHNFMGSGVAGISVTPPFIYTTTQNVMGCHYGHMTVYPNPPQPFFAFQAAPTITYASQILNTFGPFYTDAIGLFPGQQMQVCNYAIPGVLDDPFNCVQTQRNMTLGANASLTSYTNQLGTSIRSASYNGSATKTNITDALGGTDAAEITIPTTGGTDNVAMTIAGVTAGIPLFIEMDVKKGSSSALTQLDTYMAGTPFFSGNPIYSQRQIAPESDGSWARRRWWVMPPVGQSGNCVLQLQTQAGSSGTKIDIGRVSVYQADGPQCQELPQLYVAGQSVLGGKTAPAANAFGGNITWGITNGAAATAGQVGETIEADLTTPTSFTTSGTVQNFASLNLTAGDWVIVGMLQTNGNSASSLGTFNAGISTTSGSLNGTKYGITNITTAATGLASLAFPGVHIESNASFIPYLVCVTTWSGGTAPKIDGGYLLATRIR